MTLPFRQSCLALVVALGFVLSAPPAFAQDETFEPTVGQSGKDVVWVPSPDPLVETMLDI